ncbi:MAG: PTS sugar transporter subunit IIA [Eubacteriales bacterium]
MIGILVATHGTFAEGLINAVELIAGKQEKVMGIGLNHGDSIEGYEEKMVSAIQALDDGDGVLVLVDILGGSPSNCAIKCMRLENNIKALTAANMPMLVEATMIREVMTLEELSDICMATGQAGPILLNDEYTRLCAEVADDEDEEEF